MRTDLRKRNESGMILLETLVAFMGFVFLVSLFPIAMQTITAIEQTNSLSPLEVEIFFQQIDEELSQAKGIQIKGKGILFHHTYQNGVTYEQYKNVIRRQVYGQGHEVLLQHVDDVQFEDEPSSITVLVTMDNGHRYKRRLTKHVQVLENATKE